MSFPRYGGYRDSGVEGLDELPSHWSIKTLKRLCDVRPSNVDKKSYDDEAPVHLCNYTDVYYREQITSSLPFMEATASPEQIARFGLRAGDVIITKDSETADDIAIAAHVPETLPNVVCAYHLALLRPHAGTVGAFIKRFFDSAFAKRQVEVRANGLTRVGLGQYALDNLAVPTPPIQEQAEIAAFLDRETAKIDALVEAQRRLVELLKEKRQAVIFHAVTKGLNSSAPMKDSGVEWLGEVPAHWEMLSLTRVISCFVDYRGATPNKADTGIPLITAGQIKNGIIDFSLDPAYVSEEEYEARMTRGFPARGDLLLTTEAPLGEVALVEDEHVTPGQRIILMKMKPEKMDSGYLLAHFQSSFGKSELWTRSSGSTASGIRADRLRASLVMVPPLEEQVQIIRHIGEETKMFGEVGQRAENAIALLQERRAALISAAVTGKIDVRGLAQPAPEAAQAA